MATSTDSSTLAPSVVGDLSEKIGAGVDAEVDNEPATSESSQTGDDVEDTSGYPKPLALGLITMALCLAVFLVALVSFFFVSCSSDWEPGISNGVRKFNGVV